MNSRNLLRAHIRDLEIPFAVARRFEVELERVAQIDGLGFDPDEAAVILRILGAIPESVSPAPFDTLWRYAEPFLEACLTVAVVDGRYSVEQARHVSVLASRLGWSAKQLSLLEGKTLSALEAKGLARAVGVRDGGATRA